MVPPSSLSTSEGMSYPPAERKLDIGKKTGSFFSSMSLSIHYRYRPIPRRSLATHFREPMFDSAAQLKHKCWLTISETEKMRAYIYILNLLRQIWNQEVEIPFTCARKVQKENLPVLQLLVHQAHLGLILKIFSSLNDSIFPINNQYYIKRKTTTTTKKLKPNNLMFWQHAKKGTWSKGDFGHVQHHFEVGQKQDSNPCKEFII